jgi:hypothetical protein
MERKPDKPPRIHSLAVYKVNKKHYQVRENTEWVPRRAKEPVDGSDISERWVR